MRTFDPRTGNLLVTIAQPGPGRRPLNLQFASNGGRLLVEWASRSADDAEHAKPNLSLYDTATGREIASFAIGFGSAFASPRRSYAVVRHNLGGKHEARMILIDTETGATRKVMANWRGGTTAGSAAAIATHTAGFQRRAVDVFQPTNDPGSGKSGDLGHGDNTAPSRGPRLARGEQALAALVPLRAVRFPSQPNRLRVDHPQRIARRGSAVNPPESIRRTAFHTQHDSVIFEALLI